MQNAVSSTYRYLATSSRTQAWYSPWDPPASSDIQGSRRPTRTSCCTGPSTRRRCRTGTPSWTAIGPGTSSAHATRTVRILSSETAYKMPTSTTSTPSSSCPAYRTGAATHVRRRRGRIRCRRGAGRASQAFEDAGALALLLARNFERHGDSDSSSSSSSTDNVIACSIQGLYDVRFSRVRDIREDALRCVGRTQRFPCLG